MIKAAMATTIAASGVRNVRFFRSQPKTARGIIIMGFVLICSAAFPHKIAAVILKYMSWNVKHNRRKAPSAVSDTLCLETDGLIC